MRIVAIAGSNSTSSINAALVQHVLKLTNNADGKYVALTDFDIPIYNIDVELNQGFPIDVQLLKNEIEKCQGLIVSVNEHNGALSAFFKNIIDWLSRADRNFLEGKKVLLMSTSPGARGASSALEYAKQSFPRFGAQIVESFSFPLFQTNFDLEENKITDPNLALGVNQVVASFLQELEA